jgi:hypothetical protein
MASPNANPAPPTPQCRWLLERIAALDAEAELETDLARVRAWRREQRVLVKRARELGCLCQTEPNRTVHEVTP